MALIKCSECGEKVSDKAKECPKCGCPITDDMWERKCDSCGDIIPAGKQKCPHCLSENVPKKEKKRKKLIVIAIISLLVMIAGVVTTLFIVKNNEKKREEEYRENYTKILDEIFDSALDAENCASLTRKVWYNTIWEEDDEETDEFTKENGKFIDDFNDSLYNLHSSLEYNTKISSIEKSKSVVSDLMKQMKNPPKGWEEAYDELRELYDLYNSFTNMAINPSGNLNSYTEKYNTLDSDIVDQYNKVKEYIE